jgi:long-chain fatty acid transport protein
VRLPSSPRAVITGGSSGLGRALALELGRRQGRVLIADIDAEGASETARQVVACGGSAEVLVVDVGRVADLERAAERVEQLWGGIDLLVNNAGVAAAGPMGEVPLSDWEWLLRVNLWGVIHGCHVFAPRMRARGQGFILNVASSAALASLPEMGPYNASKAAVVSLSETLNAELAPFSIGVSALCPTFFETNLLGRLRAPSERQRALAHALLRRSGATAEQVARAGIEGLEQGRLIVIPQLDGKLVWWLKRLAPGAYQWLLRFQQRHDLLQRFVNVLLALLVLAAPSPSHGSGFDAPQIGSAQSGPVSNDAAAVWWNPGRLGYLTQTELLLGAGVSVGSIGYQRELRRPYQYQDNLDFAEPIAPSDIDPTKSGQQRRVHDLLLGPALDLFFASPVLRDRVVAGAGLSLPYIATLALPKDGSQRFAGDSLFLATPHTTLALAVRASEVFSIGAGVSYVLGNLALSKTQDFGSLDTFGAIIGRPPIAQANDFGNTAPSTVRELDVLARPLTIEGAFAHGASFNVGLALQLTTRLALGMVYHHSTDLRFHGRFRLDMNDDFFTRDLAVQGLAYEPVVHGRSVIHIRLPRRMTFAAGYQLAPRFALDAFASYVFYQDIDKVALRLESPGLAQERLGVEAAINHDVIRQWKGAAIVELNGRIEASDALRLSVTAGYHAPASPDATIDIISVDGDRVVLGGGMEYRFTEHAALLASLEGQFMVKRHVTTSDYDLGNGTYSLFIGAFMLHGRFLFGDGALRSNGAQAPTPPKG